MPSPELAPSPPPRYTPHAKPSRELTLAQAQDLARYFLGPEWRVRLTDSLYKPYSLSNGQHMVYAAPGWRSLFRLAGVKLPLRPQFTAQGARVMMTGDRAVATAVSNTMAKRIAAALNEHEPDRRGV